MRKKAVFFDADGTICDMKKGTPDSAIEAVRALIDNGHEAWLCTGRSRAFVPWYLEQIPFTGMITACGSTIEKDGKRLFNKEMTPEVAKLSVEVLRKYGLIPVMEGADYMYYDKDEYTDEVNWYASLITEALGDKWRPIRGNEDCMQINKISAKMTAGCDAEAALAVLSEYYDIIRHEGSSSFVGNTIELVPKGFNKAVGIAAVIRLFDIPWEDTVVFGDSNNDLAMFEYAATKVAMGNASPKIQELADHVTSDMFHYGIRDGLRYLKPVSYTHLQGYSAIEIIRSFYGNDMYINVAEAVSGIPASWPGYDLTIGVTGEKVQQIQEQLNAIAKAYPAIPTVTVDGIYGPATAASVKKFQNVFGLPASGVVDYPTWYKIQEIYVAVTRIAELR